MTPAQLANLAKGNPRVAERHKQGHYDSRIATDDDNHTADPLDVYDYDKRPSDSPASRDSIVGQLAGRTNELVDELDAHPERADELVEVVASVLRSPLILQRVAVRQDELGDGIANFLAAAPNVAAALAEAIAPCLDNMPDLSAGDETDSDDEPSGFLSGFFGAGF